MARNYRCLEADNNPDVISGLKSMLPCSRWFMDCNNHAILKPDVTNRESCVRGERACGNSVLSAQLSCKPKNLKN